MGRLLFISPVMPARTGNGRAMRAFQVLRALARDHEVSLLVIESRPGAPDAPGEMSALCRAIHVMGPRAGTDTPQTLRYWLLRRAPSLFGILARRPPEWAPLNTARVRMAAEAFGSTRFDRLHVFRLHLAPYAQPWLEVPGQRPSAELDLDDLESFTRRRIAALYKARGRRARALGCRREAALVDRLERRWLPRFERTWVCSPADAAALVRHIPGIRVRIAPNVVDLPPACTMTPDSLPFRFLFVGTLGYYPNQDALLWFADEVLPELRRQSDRRFVVTIAGAGLPPRLAARLKQEPDLDLRGHVDDLAPLYRETHAVLVPLRAGGGSRIKIIEAFARGAAVVTTPAGAEGLAVQPGTHVLMAGEAAPFAAAAVRLMADPALRRALAVSAFEQAASTYSPAALVRALETP